MKRLALVFVTALVLQCSKTGGHKSVVTTRPNIVLIYMDDMGFSDISGYGKEFGNLLTETPHMDRLIAEGLKFSQAYSSAPLCSPARAALLTGKSPARLNFEFVTKNEEMENVSMAEWAAQWQGRELLPPRFTLNLPLEEVTIAEMLKEEGYQTALYGKWHVAAHNQHYLGWSPSHGPRQQGFNYAAETFGAHPYRKQDSTRTKIDPASFADGEFPEDDLTNKAIGFIRQSHGSPFFLMVSHYFVHTPMDTLTSWLSQKYRNKGGTGLSTSQILYAGFVEAADHYVGQLLKSLDDMGLSENTVVILTSDNGGHPALAFNRPFRGSKWNLYEGGIRVPLVIRWPGIVAAGSITDEVVIQTDLVPTFLQIAGAKRSVSKELTGKSIVPVLRNDPSPEFDNRILTWHFPYYHPEGNAYNKAQTNIGVEDGRISRTTPQSAIRSGSNKLIYFYQGDSVEMYDLASDPGESNDLSTKYRARADSLKTELLKILKDEHARFPEGKEK